MWYLFAFLGIVGVAAVFAHLWLVREASRQQHRIARRLDDLAGRIADRVEPAAPAPDDRDAALLDALTGERAPGFALPNLDGERVTLDALLAPGIPLLLLFTAPRCGPCYALLPDIGGWQRVYGDRLAVASSAVANRQPTRP